MFNTLIRWGCVLVVCGVAVSAAQAKRVALLIGNAAYQHEGRLANPINDAKLLARTLQDLGFDEVKLIENADMRQLTRAVDQFERSAQGADTAVVYFSGHGQQTEDQQNYLLAVDAKIEQSADLKHDAITSDSLMQATAGAKVRLVILDACRDRPASSLTRSATKGLSRARDPSRAGLLIAYATEDGKVAQDGTAGQNSPYAAALAQALRQRDKPILAMLDDVADQVAKATQYSQNPTRSGNLRVDVYLVAPQISINQASTAAPDAELVFWDSVKNATEAADYIAYLEQYPQGRFKALAKTRIQKYSPVYASLMLDDTPPSRTSTQSAAAPSSPSQKTNIDAAALLAQGQWLDPQTGLIWSRCVLGQQWNGKRCKGTPLTLPFAQAKMAAQQSDYATQQGWRIPQPDELQALVHRQPPTGILIAPSDERAGWFWSDTDTTDSVIGVSFANGASDRFAASSRSLYVRLVRNQN